MTPKAHPNKQTKNQEAKKKPNGYVRREIFANYIFYKGLIARLCQEFLKLKIKQIPS